MKFANIDTEEFSENETLFFVRIKGKQHFFDRVYGPGVMKRMFGHIQRPHTISEYRNADHHIDLLRYELSDLTPADYDLYYSCIHENLDSILSRCRGLRDIPFDQAKKLVILSCKYFAAFFSTHDYKLLVIHTIDNYVLDVMYRVAIKMGLQVIVPTEWFIRGWYRQTAYGEIIPYRSPNNEEVEIVEQHFNEKKAAFWLEGMGRLERARYSLHLLARFWVLYVVRFLLRYKLLGDLSYEYRFAYLWRVKLSYLFVGRLFDRVTEKEIQDRMDRSVVLPLHVYPESNVDYWLDDHRHADYYSGIHETLSFFRSKQMTVFVKEHPGFLYQRDPNFYKEIKRYDNVRLVDPMSSAAKLLNQVPLVVVWLGTMGIEALMDGRKVVVFGSNYYSTGLLRSYKDFEHAKPLTESEKRKLVRDLLAGVQKL